MMAALNTFSSAMAIYAEAAPRPIMDRMYYEAAREFFRKTLTWRETGDLAAVDTYYWAPTGLASIGTNGAEVVDVLRVVLGNDELLPLPQQDFYDTFPTHRPEDTTDDTEPPTHFYLSNGGTANTNHISLAPSFAYDPTVERPDDAFYATVALTPKKVTTHGAVYLPDALMNEYHDTILHGALARLYSTPEQRWGNPRMARDRFALFNNEMDEHRSRGAYGRMKRKGRTVRYGGL